MFLGEMLKTHTSTQRFTALLEVPEANISDRVAARFLRALACGAFNNDTCKWDEWQWQVASIIDEASGDQVRASTPVRQE